MISASKTLATVAALALLSSCGGAGGGEELTCEWFTGQNCWKQVLESAAACAHDSSTTGILNADDTSCSYDDGTIINFRNPLTLDNMDDYVWDFEITKNGTQCLSFKEEPEKTLTTQLGTYTESASLSSYRITCPDGTVWQSGDPMSLLDCGFENLPGHASSHTSTSVTFSFLGGASGSLQLFSCEKQ